MAWNPFRNLGLKVLALLLGILLWFAVSGHEVERRISVPITYRNVPALLELTGEQTDTVVVHVRGDDGVINELSEGEVRVTVDLAGRRAGGNVVPLRIDQVVAPPRVDVLQIEPGTVTITLEQVAEIRVPIAPAVEGEPAPGYVVAGVTSEPADALVAGPESRITGTIPVATESVEIGGLDGTVVREVGVVVEDAQLRLVSPETVRVRVQIDPAPTVDDAAAEDVMPADATSAETTEGATADEPAGPGDR